MFFLLSKLLLFLLSPWNWVLMLCIAWITAPKLFPTHRRSIAVAIVIILVVFSNPLLHKAVLLAWQPPVKMQQHHRTCQTGILLTGITMGNSAEQRFFGAGSGDRFMQTVKLYHSGIIKQVIVNGGNAAIHSTRKPEAFFIANELKACGIPETSIIIEAKSRNTFEGAQNVAPILKQQNALNNCVLITSAMHMRRALSVFAKAGISPVPHVADYEAIEGGFRISELIPDPSLLKQWQYTLKEIVGFAAYRITGKL